MVLTMHCNYYYGNTGGNIPIVESRFINNTTKIMKMVKTKTNYINKPNSWLLQSLPFPRIFISSHNLLICRCCTTKSNEEDHASLKKLVRQFDPSILIQDAFTPPSSWYTHPSFLSLEFDRVFLRGWQAVGLAEQLKDPGSFFTGRLGNVEYVICKDNTNSDNTIRAFHNVCRHHASLLVSGTGNTSCFACPYHGWTYGLDGSLLKATRISGIRNFHVQEFGLKPLRVAIWGPFVLLNCQHGEAEEETSSTLKEADQSLTHPHVEHQWLGSSAEILTSNGIIDSSLTFICRREYTIQSNWKVFCDNYLDGGYHVPYAHKGLASSLDLNSYSTTIFEKVSIQRCSGNITMAEDEFDRLGSNALYAFIYPNFMINRYGPWMDTNLVIPLGPRKCKVIFDYFLDSSLKDNKSFIEESLKESEQVQMEDIVLCEAVQRGLESPAYNSGRYAPSVEKAMHHFHSLLHHDLI